MAGAELAFLRENVPGFLSELSRTQAKQHKQPTGDLVGSDLP
ncbi:hypothetical protein ACFQY9_24000 [Microvirga aerilata]